jgi:hypothetical protein
MKPAHLVCTIVAALFVACSGEIDQEQLVANTALLYCQYLIDGKYDDFVAGIDQHVEQAEGYEEELRDNAKMFVVAQAKTRGGLVGIEKVGAEVNSDEHTASAFIRLHYADSTTEQVVMPMVERDGVWLMR